MGEIKHINLTQNEPCGFCGTEVPAGFSVCKGCGAVHGFKDFPEQREFPFCLTFFMVGVLFAACIIGGSLKSWFMFWLTTALGVVGIYYLIKLINRHRAKKLMWWRTE